MAHATPIAGDLFAAFMRTAKAFKQMPVGPVDGPALGILVEIGNRAPVRLSDVAVCVHLDASTVSRHVTGLEREGYVAREPDPEDRRASRLVLTTTGTSVMTTAIERRRRQVDAALEHWSGRDRTALVRLLDRLADDLAAVAVPPHAPAASPPAALSLPSAISQEQPA